MINKILGSCDKRKIFFHLGVYGLATIGMIISILTGVFLSISHTNSLGNSTTYLIVLGVMTVICIIALIFNKKDTKNVRINKIILLSIFYVIFAIWGSRILLSCRESIKITEITRIVISFVLIAPTSALLFSKIKSKNSKQINTKKINEGDIIVYNYNKKSEKRKINGETISEILFCWTVLLIIFLFICIFFVTTVVPQKDMVKPLNIILTYVYLVLCGFIWANSKIEKYNLFNCIIQAIEVFAICSLALIFDFQIQ